MRVSILEAALNVLYLERCIAFLYTRTDTVLVGECTYAGGLCVDVLESALTQSRVLLHLIHTTHTVTVTHTYTHTRTHTHTSANLCPSL